MAFNFGESFKETSDVAWDFICTPCDDKDLNAEGLFFCQVCSKIFCSKCKDLHGSLLSDHSVLTKAEQSKWGTVKRQSKVLMCERHPGKEIELYCEDDDDIICMLCVPLEHRSCKSIKHILDVAAGVLKSADYKTVLVNVTKTSEKLNDQTQTRKKDKKALQQKHSRMVKAIDEFESRLVQQLSKLKKDILKEISENISQNEELIEEDIAKCNDISDHLKELQKNMTGKRSSDETLAFIGMKKCQKSLIEADNTLTGLAQNDYNVDIHLDSGIEQFLSTAKLGKLCKPSSGNDPNHTYTAKTVCSYRIKTSNDASKSDIRGCCFLSLDQVILADIRNSALKLLNKSYEVISDMKCLNGPCDVCLVSENKLCAACNDHLQFVQVVEGQLQPQNKITADHHACAVACYKNKLYVGGGNVGIYEYTIGGQMVRKFYNSCAYRVAVSLDGAQIYVTTNADSHDSLVAINEHGIELNRFNHSSMSHSTGVCVLPNGNVLVADQSSSNIIQIDSNGKTLRSILLNSADKVEKPRGICFNSSTMTLIVGQENDKLWVVKLK